MAQLYSFSEIAVSGIGAAATFRTLFSNAASSSSHLSSRAVSRNLSAWGLSSLEAVNALSLPSNIEGFGL